ASGVQGDIRKIEPYLVYDELDFDIPFRTKGDIYSRYRVRMEEMHQSTRIIRQAFDALPEDGEILKKAPRRLPKGEIYYRTSDPRGEAAYYIIGNDNKIPYRVKIKSPAYSNLALSSNLLRGVKVADIAPIVASIDLCMGEIDR
ncbi:MAG: NADH-quinone oxidoreductase subunit D-related protein, partial [Candidatus Hodarchaeales archaeon]